MVGSLDPGELEHLIRLLAKLPGLGPRSARRAGLHLLKHREALMLPLAQTLTKTAERVKACSICSNFDMIDPCSICQNPRRENGQICVVKEVGDLWALERAAVFKGHYHVTGGLLSALDGIRPEDLDIPNLVKRATHPGVTEVILAMDATVDGQTTAHYISERLAGANVEVSRLARGVPVGGELDYLDDGTLAQALKARRAV